MKAVAVKSESMKPTEEKTKGWDSYEISNACETLMKAEKIKKNAALMAEVHKHAGKQKASLNSIAELKAKHQEMFAKKKDEEPSEKSSDDEVGEGE